MAQSLIPFLPQIHVIPSQLCTQRRQFRFPRSKKRRIRRKWAKRTDNFKTVPVAYMFDRNNLVCHTSIIDELKRKMLENVGIPKDLWPTLEKTH